MVNIKTTPDAPPGGIVDIYIIPKTVISVNKLPIVININAELNLDTNLISVIFWFAELQLFQPRIAIFVAQNIGKIYEAIIT